MTVNLEQDDWNRVLAVLSQAPWNVANPLIMAIAEQLRLQQNGVDGSPPRRPDGEDIRTPDRH